MRRIRLVVALALCTLAVVVATLVTSVWSNQAPAPALLTFGGPFTVIDTETRAVSQADLIGRPTVLYFGYTYCPEVCPTTLLMLTTAMKQMGTAADALIFVSVDPGRDTPAQMKLYL